MIVHFGTDLVNAQWFGSTVCIGVFDGVHLGHQHVLQTAQAEAARHQEPLVLLTFDRHPMSTLAPDRAPLPLASLSQNLDKFQEMGVAVAVVLTFDRATSATPADEFLKGTLQSRLRAKRLVVGHDFALGKGREGDGDWLRARIETTIVPPFEREGHRVSSSEIRSFVVGGAIERANDFLGRPFELRGVVVSGQQLGRTLGFPTANLALSTVQCVPQDGVYGGWCKTKFGEFRAAIGVGMRPTVGGLDRTVEAYLLDFPGADLYGSVVDLGFSFRVRDEMHFADLETLKTHMDQDVALVRSRLV